MPVPHGLAAAVRALARPAASGPACVAGPSRLLPVARSVIEARERPSSDSWREAPGAGRSISSLPRRTPNGGARHFSTSRRHRFSSAAGRALEDTERAGTSTAAAGPDSVALFDSRLVGDLSQCSDEQLHAILEDERQCDASITVSDAYLELRSRDASVLAALSDNAVAQLCSYAGSARLSGVIALLLSDLQEPGHELTPALLFELRQGALPNDSGARIQRSLEALLAAAGSSARLRDDPEAALAFLGPASSEQVVAGVRSLELVLAPQLSRRLLRMLAESYSLGVASSSALDTALARALVSAVLRCGDIELFPALEVFLALLGGQGTDELASWEKNWRRASFPDANEAGLLVEYYLIAMDHYAVDARATQQCRESALRIVRGLVERGGLGQTLLERAANDASSCEEWLDDFAKTDEARRWSTFIITMRTFCLHAFIVSSLWSNARGACLRLSQELGNLRSAASASTSSAPAGLSDSRELLPQLCGSLARRVVFATTQAGNLREAVEACASFGSMLLLEPEVKPGAVTQEIPPDAPHVWLDELIDAVSMSGEEGLTDALTLALSQQAQGSLRQVLSPGRMVSLLACVPTRNAERMIDMGRVFGLWDEQLDSSVDQHFEESLRPRVIVEVARSGAKDLARQLWLRWAGAAADGAALSEADQAVSGVVRSALCMLSVVRLFAGRLRRHPTDTARMAVSDEADEAHTDRAFATHVLRSFISSRAMDKMDGPDLSATARAFFALDDPNSAFGFLTAMLRRNLVPSAADVHHAVRELEKINIDQAADILTVYGESAAHDTEATPSRVAAIYQMLLASVAIHTRYDLVPRLLASEYKAGVQAEPGVVAVHTLIEQFKAFDRATARQERDAPMRRMRDLVRTCLSDEHGIQLGAPLLNTAVSKACMQLRAFAPPAGQSGPAQARWIPYGAQVDGALQLLRLVSAAGLAYRGTVMRVIAAVRSHWDHRRRKAKSKAGVGTGRTLTVLREKSLLQIDELVGTVRWSCNSASHPHSHAHMRPVDFRHMVVTYLALGDVDGAIEVVSWMRELDMVFHGDPHESRFLQDLRQRAETDDASLAETRLLRLAGEIPTPHTKLWWERVKWQTSIPRDSD